MRTRMEEGKGKEKYSLAKLNAFPFSLGMLSRGVDGQLECHAFAGARREADPRQTMMSRYEDSAIQSALAVAVERLGYSSLRTQQEVVVRSFVQGNDAFICLPTGSGNSLCYCILPAVLIPFVVSSRRLWWL